MRILAIRGSNLASLAGEFAIDFTEAPLAEAGIFAITGPTGAGKSTLLDAMCLALFAEVPRLRAAPDRAQVGEDGEQTLSAKDTRSILRHGAAEGFAEIDFALPGGTHYRARWSVRRARGKADGKLQNYQHSLENLTSGEGMGGTRRETQGAIRDLIGLSAEQFTRAVLLAQGDFEALIRADANERSELLEKLTGSQIYSRLGQRAYAKAREMQDGLDAIAARIAALEGLDDTARAEAEDVLKQAEAELSEAEAARAQLSAIEQRLAQHARLNVAHAQAQAIRDEAAQAQDVARPRHQALAQDRKAFEHAPLLTRREDARTALAAARAALTKADTDLANARTDAAQREEELGAALKAVRAEDARAEACAPQLSEARLLDRQIEELVADLAQARARQRDAENEESQQARTERDASEQLETSRREHARLAQWCADNEAARHLAERESEIAEALASRAATRARQREAIGRLDELAQAEQDALARHARAQDAEEAARSAHEAAQDLRDAARGAAPAPGALGELNTRLEALGEALDAARRARTAQEALARTQAEQDEAQGQLAVLERQGQDHAERIAREDVELPLLATRAENARAAYERARMAQDAATQTLRAGLVEGDPCPVCGAREHALSALDALLGENLTIAERETEELARELEQRGTQLAVTRDALGRVERERTHATQRIAQLSQTATSQQEAAREELAQARAAATRLTIAEADRMDAETLEARLDEASAEVRAAQRTSLAADAARTEAQAKADAAQATHEAARSDLSQASDALRSHAQALREGQEHAGRLAENEAATTAALDRLLGPESDWQSLPDPEHWLRSHAAQWRDNAAARDTAAQALPEREEAHAAARQALALARSAHAAARETLDQILARQSALQDARAKCLEGEPVATFEANLARARKEAEQAHEAARKCREGALEAAASARTAQANAASDVQKAEAHAARTDADFTAALAAAHLAEDDVLRAAQRGAAALDAEAEALRSIASALEQAQAVLAQRRADLDSHEAEHAGTETPAPEELEDQVAIAKAGVETANTRRDEARLVLIQDDKVRKQTEDLRRELSEASAKADVWLRLRDVMGSADGKVMRTFAQGLTLDRLLEHANTRLAELKPRYELERGQGGDMLIQVIDNDMGGQVRGLHNLSGGERFLVSLALALGLAEMSTTRGVKIESLFIDEGFGALDPVSLGQALALLEQLEQGGRRVGIISHVEELKERIPVKIEVSPSGRGTSTVSVVEG